MKQIACLVPLSWDSVPSCFLHSWAVMTDYAHGKYKLKMVAIRSPYMDSLRDILAQKALESESDYILWLDADQVYPYDTPERLMKHVDDGKFVVGGITPLRATGQPMVYDFKDDGMKFTYRTKNNHLTGVQKVGGMGMGGIMVHPRVYSEFLEPPFFQMVWDPKTGRQSGEDVVFFKKCHDAGINVWCDYDLMFKHLTTVEIGIRWDE